MASLAAAGACSSSDSSGSKPGGAPGGGSGQTAGRGGGQGGGGAGGATASGKGGEAGGSGGAGRQGFDAGAADHPPTGGADARGGSAGDSSTGSPRDGAVPSEFVVGEPILVPDNRGDTWAPAWTASGDIISPSNDTNGFKNAGTANVAVNRITGNDPKALKGETLTYLPDFGGENVEGPDGCTWKSMGCASIDGTLYLFVSRHNYGQKSGDPKRRQTAINASLMKSTDGGKTWARSAAENYDHPMFPGSRFATPYFVDYGQDFKMTADGSDRYVYAVSNNGFWDNGDSQILGRVLRSKIANLSASDWQFYTAGDGSQDASWSSDVSAAKPLIEAPGKLGMTGAAYLPAQGRYLMINWYYTAGSGKIAAPTETVWDFYTATKPWGPWVKVNSHKWNPQGYYGPQIAAKFSSADNRSLFAVTAGDWDVSDYYRMTLVPLTW